jgi:hypothetical protein
LTCLVYSFTVVPERGFTKLLTKILKIFVTLELKILRL